MKFGAQETKSEFVVIPDFNFISIDVDAKIEDYENDDSIIINQELPKFSITHLQGETYLPKLKNQELLLLAESIVGCITVIETYWDERNRLYDLSKLNLERFRLFHY